MKKKLIPFTDEQIADAKILSDLLGITTFVAFARICVQKELRLNAKEIEKARKSQSDKNDNQKNQTQLFS